MKLETIKVVHLEDGTKPMIINESDYDPDVHVLWEKHLKEALKQRELDIKKRKAKEEKKRKLVAERKAAEAKKKAEEAKKKEAEAKKKETEIKKK